MSAVTEALVIRHLAELRRANWSLDAAIEFVHAELPKSPFKERLHSALASLRASTASPSAESLVTTLGRGDAISTSVLEQLADSREAAEEAHGSVAMTRAAVSAVLCVCTFVVMRLAGTFADSLARLYLGFGSKLPAPTQMLLDVAQPIHIGAPFALGLALLIVWRSRFDGLSGLRELQSAGLLLQYSGALDAGIEEDKALRLIDPTAQSLQQSKGLRLDAQEKAFLTHAMKSRGAAAAARGLAHELKAQGRTLASENHWWRSAGLAAVVVLTATFVSGALIAMYLPIFSVAAAMK